MKTTSQLQSVFRALKSLGQDEVLGGAKGFLRGSLGNEGLNMLCFVSPKCHMFMLYLEKHKHKWCNISL